MSVPASTPSTPANRLSWLGWLLSAVGVVLLTIVLYQPPIFIFDLGLDHANYGAYAFFAAHRLQYGTEVVAMAGPYGFIPYGILYAGELFWTRFFLELLTKAVLAGLLVWHLRYFAYSAWAWFWLLLTVISGVCIWELLYNYCLLLSGLFLLLSLERPRYLVVQCLVAVFLAMLSLTKGTQTIMALMPLALLFVAAWLTGRMARFCWIGLSYVGGYILLWMLAGQRVGHLGLFLKGVMELAAGYGVTMGLQETPAVMASGIVITVLLLLGALCGLWCSRQSVPRFLAVLLMAGYSFYAWKHGFVRADVHVYLLYHFAYVAAMILILLVPSPAAGGSRGLFLAGRGLALAAVGVSCWYGSDEGRVSNTLRDSSQRILVHTTAHLFRPVEAKARLERRLQASREKFRLPEISRVLGQARVDFFGFEHSYVLLNHLNYAPRPMSGGSFNVYNPYVMRLNERFLADPEARPDFYLLKYQPTDGKLGAQEDALTLRALLNFYSPEFIEKGVVVLRADPRATAVPVPRPLASVRFAFGEQVAVPAVGNNEILLLRLEVPSSLTGRLVQFLYKPAEIHMELSGEGISPRTRRRILPMMMQEPVIFSPFVDDTVDFGQLYTDQPGRNVRSFTVTTESPGQFGAVLHAEFLTVPRPAPRDVAFFRELKIWDRDPLAVDSSDAHRAELDGRLVLFVHPPGSMTFPLTAADRELRFDGGLFPGAYVGGQTDGVGFGVEIEEDGQRRKLFRRVLDPRKNPADRGAITFGVGLPAHGSGAKAILTVDPGPADNLAWDWAFVSRIRIGGATAATESSQPGAALLKLGGLKLLTAEFSEFREFEHEGRRSLFVHAPGTLTCALTGAERELSFLGGMVPGSYTEGKTDGVVFEVDLEENGRRQNLLRRGLNPRQLPDDRKAVPIRVALPAHGPGARLILAVNPGAAGNNAWDWSYVSEVKVK